MIKVIRATLICLLLIFWIPHAQGETYVIVSSGYGTKDNISLDDLRSIFLGQKLFSSKNERIYPFCSNLSLPSVSSFIHEVLNMEPDQYENYWRRKLFSGKGHPPKEFNSDSEALGFIRANPTSIGVLGAKPQQNETQGLVVFQVDSTKGILIPNEGQGNP